MALFFGTLLAKLVLPKTANLNTTTIILIMTSSRVLKCWKYFHIVGVEGVVSIYPAKETMYTFPCNKILQRQGNTFEQKQNLDDK